MIASDLHGSAFDIRKLLKRFEEEGAGRLLLLGDILYHGPRNALPGGYDTKAAAELLNERADIISAVRGNCDAEVDQMMLRFPIMAEYAVFAEGGVTAFACHGHRREEVIPLVQEGGVLLSGHTHVPEWTKREGKWLFNPGSVGIPKGGSEKSYMVWEDGGFVWKKLETGAEYHRVTVS